MTQIIDQLPLPVPSRTDPTNFSVRADNFLGELPDFATQVNALATELTALGNTVETNKNTAVTAANNAQASAFAATGSANNAASSSGAALWVSGTTYSVGNLVYSPITGRTYRRKIAGAGTTDPSADATNWIPIVLEISTQYPTIRPSLNLDFVNNKYLDPRITFTRSSTAKYFDGKTVHKAEENLLIRSEEFDNAAWTLTNATVTANTQVNPFGQSVAETLTENTSTGTHRLFQLFGCAAGLSYTASIYVKYTSRQHIQLALSSSGFDGNSYANFDVQNGTLGTVGSSATAVITSVGNGWYRCSISCISSSSQTATALKISMITASNSALDQSYTGSTSNSVYIFGAQVEQRSVVGPYQATTTQPITNYQSTLVTASVNQPRFDHDPVTKECKGLLIEDATTNLLTYSEDFGNAVWAKAYTNLAAESSYSPAGTLSARRIIESTANGQHMIASTVTPTSGVTYTYSVYAKKAEKSTFQLLVSSGTSLEYANFNLSTGVLGTVSASSNPTMNHVGNGWYRCSISIVSGVSAVTDWFIWLTSSDTAARAQTYTGDGYSGIYIWGAQLEANAASPSSYVATAGATASRSYDNAIMTGTNFSNWYNQEEGSVFSEFKVDQKPLSGYYNNYTWTISESSGSQMFFTGLNVNGFLRSQVFYNGTGAATLDSLSAWVNNTLYRVGFSVVQDGFNVSYNSANIVSDSTGNLFKNMSTLYLGAQSAGVSVLRGHLRRFTYYPKKLTNQELQTLTAI